MSKWRDRVLESLGAWVRAQVVAAIVPGMTVRFLSLETENRELRATMARIEAAQDRLLLLLEPAARRLQEPARPMMQDWDEVQRENLAEFEEK